jgi:hypothetical protein
MFAGMLATSHLSCGASLYPASKVVRNLQWRSDKDEPPVQDRLWMMDVRGRIVARALASNARNRTVGAATGLILDCLADPDFIAVCAFVAVGLLASVCLAMLFPFSDETVGLLSQFLG